MGGPRPDRQHRTDVVWSDAAGDPSSPLAVVVHGSMDRSAGLLRLSRRLDTRFHVVRYDRRGYGRSAALGPPYGVGAHVADLADLVRRSGRGRAAVVFGHSFGGDVALALAEQHPELVDSVAVYETPLSWLEWWPGDSSGSRAVATANPGDAAEAFMRRFMGDARWERLAPAKRRARRAEGTVLVGELGDLRRRPAFAVDEIAVPVLPMYGEHAATHHRRAMTLIADATGCVPVEIEGAGHTGPHTHADAVAGAVIRFVG